MERVAGVGDVGGRVGKSVSGRRASSVSLVRNAYAMEGEVGYGGADGLYGCFEV